MRISDWSSDVCSSDLAFTQRLKGEQGEFWMPTFVADLVIAEAAANGTNELLVEGSEIADDYGADAVHKAIAVRLADGSWQFGLIEGSEERSVGKELGSTCRSRWWPSP